MSKFKLSEEALERLEDGSELIVSVSGGKDSTATCLFLFENGYSTSDFKRIFADTGWESLETYKYLDELEKTIGPIHRVSNITPLDQFDDETQAFILEEEARLGRPSAMIRQVFKKYMWPSYFTKWCTRELKLDPLNQYFETLENDFINVVGVRREESQKRSQVSEFEWNPHVDAWLWRPLYNWTEEDVIDIHHRFGLVPNQLYLNGLSRVGCWPCIYADSKAAIKLLDQSRIDLIDRVERFLAQKTRAHYPADHKAQNVLINVEEKFGFLTRPFYRRGPIQEVYKWSRDELSGQQLKLFDMETKVNPGCAKWGLCDFTGSIRNFGGDQ
jgi:3'-phosphoadenosine 5'-phosphosulfate sulfotransferase (PAPS reductase)/FAD synthetase